MPHIRSVLIVLVVGVILSLLWISGCGDKSTNGGDAAFANYNFLLTCYNEAEGKGFLHIYNAIADSLLDSIQLSQPGEFAIKGPIVTRSGHISYVVRPDWPDNCRIQKCSWPSMDSIETTPVSCDGLGDLELSDNEAILRTGHQYYGLPGANHLYTCYDEELREKLFINHREKACLYYWWRDTVLFVDFSGGSAEPYKKTCVGDSGYPYFPRSICSSLSGDSLYIVARLITPDTALPYFMTVSSDSLELLSSIPLPVPPRPNFYAKLHPDGKTIYWVEVQKWPDTDQIAYKYDIATNTSEVILTDQDVGKTVCGPTCIISPDGSTLAIKGSSDVNFYSTKYIIMVSIPDHQIRSILEFGDSIGIGSMSFCRVP